MKKRIVSERSLEAFERYLIENERAEATVQKYLRDVRLFAEYAENRVIDKVTVLNYKAELAERYAVRSANSMLASLNAFLRFIGWADLCVKQFKIQQEAYC